MDVGTTLAYLEAEAPRASCKRHGVVVAAVPWARHDSAFTRQFEDQVAWLTVHASKIAVSQLMRIAWRSVGWICTRVTAEATATRDLFAGLKRIGIDEISIRKGQRYLTVVLDHDTGRLVWAGPGRDKQTVLKFLELLGKDRCHELKLISYAMAESFVDSFKTELIRDRVWRTRAQMELAVLEWVHWFNHDRPHESLGDVPPVEVEDAYCNRLPTSPPGSSLLSGSGSSTLIKNRDSETY